MKFDSVDMLRRLDEMKEEAQKSGKVLALDQGNFFVGMARKFGWKAAPTKPELDAVGERLGNRLKRKKGVSPAQEIARRKRARGIFAKGWFIAKVESGDDRIQIWIANLVTYAGIVDGKKSVATRAAEVVGKSFNRKLVKAARNACEKFNGRPNVEQITGMKHVLNAQKPDIQGGGQYGGR